jgi:hypothetical protein
VESGGVWWVSDERNGEWEGDDVGVRGMWMVEEWKDRLWKNGGSNVGDVVVGWSRRVERGGTGRGMW